MRTLLLALLAAGPAAAQAWREEPRTVLGLYRPEHIPGEVKDPYFLPLHQRVELPLNHLGLALEFLDASRPLPDPAALPHVRGVVAWLPGPKSFPDPRPVCRWLDAMLAAGKRVALLGELGLYSTPDAPYRLAPECARVLRALGAEAGGARNVEPLGVRLERADPALIGFERKPDLSESGAVPLVRLLPGATGYLRLGFTDGDWRASEPVAAGPRGGFALSPFWLYANDAVDPPQFRWVTDPFRFLERAFGAQGLPRPDPATLSGRRVYFSHVDGDGFFNLSELDRKKTSGEIFLREVLERWPASPFSVSLIAGYYDLTLYGDEAAAALSRRLLSLRSVEPAAHGYAHPLDWRKGSLALRIPRYAMDPAQEVAGAVRLITERVLKGARAVRLYQWTGDCLPDARTLAAADAAGLVHINGGGGRLDRRFPSYAYLFPLGRKLDGARQIYAPAFNENEYTELWSSRYYGYRDAIETFARTGAPRRVKPVNVYVHFYSAEKYAALAALKRVYAWAHAQELIPVWASRYAEAAGAFFALRVERLGADRWRLTGGEALRTVRFDAEPRVPALGRSRGVLGFRREGDSLYVSLAQTGPREIVLAAAPGPGVYLEQANFELQDWRAGPDGASFKLAGWWAPEFTLGGLRAGGRYRVRGLGHSAGQAADAAGKLSVRFPPGDGSRPVGEITVEPG